MLNNVLSHISGSFIGAFMIIASVIVVTKIICIYFEYGYRSFIHSLASVFVIITGFFVVMTGLFMINRDINKKRYVKSLECGYPVMVNGILQEEPPDISSIRGYRVKVDNINRVIILEQD